MLKAVFLLNIDTSCRGLSGDSVVATIRRKTGLALPGGKVEKNETEEEALIREIKEEIGLNVKIERKIHEEIIDDYLPICYLGNLTGTKTVSEQEVEFNTVNEVLNSQSNSEIRRWSLRVFLKIGVPINSISDHAWINCFGSGTLKVSTEVNSAWKDLYFHERTALEIGPEWNCICESRINIGKPIAINDCPGWTESLWQYKRMMINPLCFEIEVPKPQWIIINEDNYEWKGLGMVFKPNLKWWPNGRIAVAKFFEWRNGKFERY